MGQKANPIGLRVTINKNWDSKWFASKNIFGDWLNEDLKIRDFVKKQFYHAAISKVTIERFANRIRVNVFTARPGLLIGKKGADLKNLEDSLKQFVGDKEIQVEPREIKQAETDAQLVAENIAMQLERRISFRKAMKKAIATAMDLGVEGIRIACAGRLGGAELARKEHYMEGRVPLHTLRANIDYGFAEANTTAGKIGVKVWICKQHSIEEDNKNAVNAQKSKAQKGPKRKPGRNSKK